jgi:hypothetical protein
MTNGGPITDNARRCLTDAREELRQVREWLLQPSAETLAACPAALEHAVACVQELSGQPDLILIQPLRALSAEIASTQALLQAAGDLYFGRLSRVSIPG